MIEIMPTVYDRHNWRGCWNDFRNRYDCEKTPVWRQLLFWASQAGELELLESDKLKSSGKPCRPLDGQGQPQGSSIDLLANRGFCIWADLSSVITLWEAILQFGPYLDFWPKLKTWLENEWFLAWLCKISELLSSGFKLGLHEIARQLTWPK